MTGWMLWLTGSKQAEADARHLRERYGEHAEAWCAGALAALPAGDARRSSIRQIAKALHRFPSRDLARGGQTREDWTLASSSALSLQAVAHRAKPVAQADLACERSDRRKRPNWAE
jgi:hypothetical protein